MENLTKIVLKSVIAASKLTYNQALFKSYSSLPSSVRKASKPKNYGPLANLALKLFKNERKDVENQWQVPFRMINNARSYLENINNYYRNKQIDAQLMKEYLAELYDTSKASTTFHERDKGLKKVRDYFLIGSSFTTILGLNLSPLLLPFAMGGFIGAMVIQGYIFDNKKGLKNVEKQMKKDLEIKRIVENASELDYCKVLDDNKHVILNYL